MLDRCHSSKGLLLEGAILDAVERDDQGDGWSRVAAMRHCRGGSRHGRGSELLAPAVTVED